MLTEHREQLTHCSYTVYSSMMNMALTYSSPYLSNLSAIHLSQIVQTCGETAIFTKVLITVACFSKNSVHAKHVGRI